MENPYEALDLGSEWRGQVSLVQPTPDSPGPGHAEPRWLWTEPDVGFESCALKCKEMKV